MAHASKPALKELGVGALNMKVNHPITNLEKYPNVTCN